MLNESSFAGISASVSPLIADEESAILEFLLAQAKASMERGDSIPKLYQEQLSVFDRVLRRATRSSKLVMRAATSAVRAELARSTRNDVESVGGSLADLPRAVRSELATSATNTLVGVRDIVRRDNLAMADGARRLWTDVVASGVSAYNSGSLSLGDALRQMAERLGEGGISIIDYRSGQKTSIEAAIMRHLRTQLGQAACANTLATCQAIGCTLVEVTRTAAPRPSHAKWEGKVYRITDDRSDYPDFWEGTGYEGKRGPYTRLGDRLQGVNCGHTIGPYYDWMEPRWGDDPFSEEEKEERYKFTQTQRRYEREIRKAKRQASLLESQGLPNAKARVKIGTYQKKVRTLVSENADVLRREPRREWAATVDGRQPVALTSLKTSRTAFMGREETKAAVREAGVSASEVNRILAHNADDFDGLPESGKSKALRNAIAITLSRKVGLNRAKSMEHVEGTPEHARRVARSDTPPSVFPEGTTTEDLKRLGVSLIGRGIVYQNRETSSLEDGSTPGSWWDGESYVLTDHYTVHYSKAKGYHIVPTRPSWLISGGER